MVGNGPIYRLIWDNDNNGKSLVWLDSTGSPGNDPVSPWLHVQAVNASLVYTLDPIYAVNWTDAVWRQPSGAAMQFCQCASTSELGHLFYDELGLTAPLVNAANPNNAVTLAELNAGEFDHLAPMKYWQETWPNSYFHMGQGASVMISNWITGPFVGIAVREGRVSTLVPVSEPSTVLLMAVALAALRLRRRYMAVILPAR